MWQTSVSLATEPFLQVPRHLVGDEIVDLTAEGRELLDTARPEETVLGGRHQVYGLDIRRLPAVELVHLQLVLEVRDRAQALDDRHRPALARELDDQRAERLDRDVR